MLDWPRGQLVERIDARVEAMFDAGLVDEVRRLLAASLPPGRTASQAVGYREVMMHLRGELSLDDTQALVKTRTRQFAKRQGTWFRSLSECRRVPLAGGFEPEVVGSGNFPAGGRRVVSHFAHGAPPRQSRECRAALGRVLRCRVNGAFMNCSTAATTAATATPKPANGAT